MPGSRISYCEATHGSHTDFCRGQDFLRYRDEVRQNLDFLRDFCQQHRMPDVCRIGRQFDLFFSRRFNEAYFDTHAHLIDSVGKRVLDNICDMIRNERISLDTRRSAIRRLSAGVDVCASGTTANLIAVDRELALSSEGIRAALWKTKEDLTRGVLLQAVSAQYGKARGYRGNEIHYVNAAWNYVAESVGLSEIPDLMARTLQLSFLERCKNEVHAALTPARLARMLAEPCLDIFTSGIAARGLPSSGDCTARTNEAFGELLAEIRLQFQLGPETLRLHTFARLDDDGMGCHLRRDASLIARDLLIAMHNEQLLNEEPCDLGAWQSADGEQYTLYTFGADLAWRARQYGVGAGAGPGPSAWDVNADVEPVTISEVKAWCAVWRQDGNPPSNAVRQAALIAGPEDLANMPQDWLRDSETMRALLATSKRELVRWCLRANFSYFLKDFPAHERAALIDNYMDVDEAMLRLACRWYTDPWMLMGAARGREGRSRLQQWVASGNAQAIDALLGTVDGKPYLETGRAVPTSTIFLVLRGLEAIPMLAEAMLNENVQAIDAWCRLVTHPAIFDRVKYRLPDLLAARSLEGYTGVEQALARGNWRWIRQFHAMLKHPLIFPNVVRRLPGLLVSKVWDGKTGLPVALRANRHMAIGAFGDLLSDPDITPRIKHLLPQLLAAKTHEGDPGLARALDRGHAPAIKAFHDVAAHPGIVPHIARVLPKLLAAKLRDGTPGLWRALRNNRDAAIAAFGDILADPNILPCIQHVLVDLLAARDASGTAGMSIAARKEQFLAMASFSAILEKPAIARHIEGRRAEIVPAPPTRTTTTESRVEESLPARRSSLRASVRRFFHRVAGRLMEQRAA